MAKLDHKYEAAADACRRFWQGQKEKYHQEGLTAPIGAECPYPRTSFAAQHWERGALERSE